tara:strand:+ start:3040 stop:4182 length:1143 start_codon:yes stop_codon:yes gene_type:complete
MNQPKIKITQKIICFVMLLFASNAFGQAPEKFTYQAVVRDANNALLNTQQIGVQVSILQGSATGTPVYVETHAPTTNVNGLVSLEVGEGAVVSGTFNTIDWADGPYFIKTETDPNGGSNYSISGTSQLVTVPYAFYANTANVANVADSISPNATIIADSVSPNAILNELDPVFDTSVAGGITTNDTMNWNAHTDSTDIAQMGYVAGLKTYEVGDFAQGGVVFWVDETKQHGLVCMKENLASNSTSWYAGTYGTTRAVGDGIYGGESNTNLIIAAQISIGDNGSDYAASLCSDAEITENGITYGDWYLPSKEELYLIGANYATIDVTAIANGGTAIAYSPYWTSMEVSTTNAIYVVITPTGTSDATVNKAATFNVRAIRAF